MAYCRNDVYMYRSATSFVFHYDGETHIEPTAARALCRLIDLHSRFKDVGSALQRLTSEIKEGKWDNEESTPALELVDGARPAVELFVPKSPAQKKWREDWLEKARTLLKGVKSEK